MNAVPLSMFPVGRYRYSRISRAQTEDNVLCVSRMSLHE